MTFPKSNHVTTGMIYFGTFLVSVLSFFTTFNGMLILVSWPLALLGSLGIQTALLGIAWNLMRIKGNRATYVIVFSIAASFSIFFSYANFNFNLKANTRGQKVRAAYAEVARPVVREYGSKAKEAVFKANYQRERVGQLEKLEEEKGWATIVDEGSQDAFVQAVIDGARRTVDSWKRTQGSDYRQGAGRGIISKYLQSWDEQLGKNLTTINSYIAFVDSAGLVITGAMPVPEQYELVNQIASRFPVGEIAQATSATPTGMPEPPNPASYIEKPMNSQEALMLVIGDLSEMDHLTFFSLMFAIAVDLIVIVMAFAGSRVSEDVDYLFNRVQKDSFKRTKKMQLDDPRELSKSLDLNLERMRIASRYGLALSKALKDFERNKQAIRLVKGPEEISANNYTGENPLFTQIGKWVKVDGTSERKRVNV